MFMDAVISNSKEINNESLKEIYREKYSENDADSDGQCTSRYCVDSQRFNAGYGRCRSYGKGGNNHGRCKEDGACLPSLVVAHRGAKPKDLVLTTRYMTSTLITSHRG